MLMQAIYDPSTKAPSYGIEVLVTRNGSDVRRATAPIYTPAKFAQAMAGNRVLTSGCHLVSP